MIKISKEKKIVKNELSIKITGVELFLTTVFAVLKYLGVVNWSWFIVSLPFIIGLACTILVFIGMFLFTLIISIKNG